MNNPSNTPAFPTTGASITVDYTGYKAWSSRSYYGTKSGVKAFPTSVNCTVGRITEKAIELKMTAVGGPVNCWVPKSCISEVEGRLTVSRGFCYRNGGLQWKRTYEPRRPWVHANNGRSFTMAG
jgi:hypothetical protein